MSEPHGIGYGSGAVWLAGHHSASVYFIDPETNEMTGFTGAPDQAQDVLVAFDSLWIPGTGGPMVRLDPKNGELLASFPTYSDAEAGFESVWAVSRENDLERIDPTSDEVTFSVKVGRGSNDYNNSVAIGQDYVWVAVPDRGRLKAFDPVSGAEAVDLDVGGPGIVAAGGAGVWMALESGTVLRVDEATGAIATSVETDSVGYNLIEVGEASVWFAGHDRSLRELDGAGGELRAMDLSASPDGLLIQDGSAWVAYYGIGHVERIDLDSIRE